MRDVVGDLRRVEVEPLADGADDAAVGLVVGEQVDVAELEAGGRNRRMRRGRHVLDGGPERRAAAHPDHSLVVVRVDQRLAGRVGAEHHGPDPRRALAGRHEYRSGAIREQRRRGAVVVVGHAAQQVGADHEHAVGAPRLDLRKCRRSDNDAGGNRGYSTHVPRSQSHHGVFTKMNSAQARHVA